MEALAESLADDVVELKSNFDGSTGTFFKPPSKDEDVPSVVKKPCSVRYVEDKLIPAFHPPDVVGGGSFEISRGQPLSDKFTGMIDTITGELVHGKRLYVLTGEIYEGPFSNGVRHGDGAIVHNLYMPRYCIKDSSLPIITSKSQFYGNFRNDKPQYGTLVVSSQGLGFTYHGPFHLSKPHGRNGTLVKPSGYKYVGDFMNGHFHGHGVEYEEKHVGGGTYEGSFVDGVRQGFGTYTIRKPNTRKQNDEKSKEAGDIDEYFYKGRWHGNQKQGDGEELIHGREFYKGQFHMNLRHGFGSLSMINDGDKDLESDESQNSDGGVIEADEANEAGEEKFAMVKAEGQWRAGKPLDGTNGWTLVARNGDVYSGFASNFIPQGHGIMQYKNKDVYTGQWKDGKRNGEGMFISADGREEYIGQWINDKIAPSIIMSKDDGVSRITDLTQVLLTSQNKLQNNENTNKVSYQNQLDLLQKIANQSLSQSLMHFENDVKSTEVDKYATTNWADLSYTDSDCTDTCDTCAETCTETTIEDNNMKDGSSAIIDNPQEVSCIETDTDNELKAQLINYPNGDTYLGTFCKETRCRDGHGVYLSVASGTTYSGTFNADMRQGFGILIHPLGKYCGEFFEDKKQGKGTLILNDTSSYNGQFKDNNFHGRGTLCNKNGVYVGEWVDGMKQGDGYETLPDGRVYMGDFHNSKRHGNGTLLSERCGQVEYNGSWQSGMYHGEGLLVKYIKADDNVQRRKSLSGEKNDKVIPMIRYEGSFYNGLRHGYGTLINTVDNSVFSGDWRKDSPAPGKWKIKVNGTSYSGEASVFEDDVDCSVSDDDEEGVTKHFSLQSFEEVPTQLEVENLILPQPHGFGTMKYSNGDVYVGKFARGLRQGPGTCVYAENQERWDGQWFNDKQKVRRSCIANVCEIDDNIEDLGFEDISFDE